MSNYLKKVFNISNKIRIGIINTFFWIIIIFLIYLLSTSSEEVNWGETLYLQINGAVQESGTEDDLITLVTSENFEVPKNTLLRDLLGAIEQATADDSIKNMVIDLDSLDYIGLASNQEVGEALDKFKNSNKEIYVYSSFFDRDSYYLASFASSISMDPFGEVNIDGISVYRSYLKNAIDKYDVDVTIFRAGDYKSYVEPYMSDSMSKGVKEQNLLWMNSIWDNYISQISKNRGFNSLLVDSYFSNRLDLTKKYSGDLSALALNEGFVDTLESRNQFFDRFPSLVYYKDYIDKSKNDGATKVAVITLEGPITYSDNSPGSISAVDTEQLLDSVLDSDLEGVILRINSGGGGVYASEIIRRKVEEVNRSIPVVISMGDVCASGGYWIATAGSKIYADHSTITGSIGVFGLIYGVEKTLENNFGIKTDGVSTTPNLEPVSLTKSISRDRADIIQLNINDTYSKFKNLVAKSRGIDINSLESIASGRVWSGAQAVGNGLVDAIGGLGEAKQFFGNDVQLIYKEGDIPLFDEVLKTFTSYSKVEIKVLEEFSIFERINDPKNIYALWF